jgi:hypothetical protein
VRWARLLFFLGCDRRFESGQNARRKQNSNAMKAIKQTISRLVMGCALALGLFTQTTQAQPVPPGGGSGCTNCPPQLQNTNRNYVKFMAHEFTMIDTNQTAQVDTNLYEALLSFPPDTNSGPNLQVLLYGTNTLLIKANQFDYSAETNRDFALLICDKVETPIWKAIDFLGASDAEDGWLVQGTVPHWSVTDLMYFKIENIARDCNAFFRAIPYGGAEIAFTSPQPYDTVSNTIAVEVTIADLSGVTNTQFEVTLDGLPPRYSLGTNSTITLNTKYNAAGPVTLYLRTVNRALVCDLTNAPDNSRVFFSSLASLPLTFENDTYLLFQSDNASPEIGTNYFYYVTDRPQTITASIYDPSDNRTLKSFYGYVPYAATISLSWNFTESDGTTPYTNDTYAVHFETSNPTTLTVTNKIDRKGVRPGAGCFLTYQEEDPGDNNGSTWNDKAFTWVKETLQFLYKDQYKPLSLTQYTTSQVGTNRNKANCVALTPNTPIWADFMPANLANSDHSDLTIAGAHCNGFEIGYSKAYLNNKFDTYALRNWIDNTNSSASRRLRKTAIWACYSGAETGDLTFAQACGILPQATQMNSFNQKNAGLFFQNKLPQFWITGGQIVSTAQAAAAFDQAFICGKNAYPGGCDPTYSIRWALAATLAVYPEMDVDPATGKTGLAKPILYGSPKLIHTTIYDHELMLLNFNNVKEN